MSLLQLERQDAHLEQEDAHANRNGDSAAPSQVLEWNVAEYKGKLRKGGEKIILQNVVGRAEAGTFNGILGSSGCGKTSLLNCLALRNSCFTGALRLDGRPLNETFLSSSWVCPPEGALFPACNRTRAFDLPRHQPFKSDSDARRVQGASRQGDGRSEFDQGRRPEDWWRGV